MLGLVGLLGMGVLANRDPESAQAQGSSGCHTVPNGSQGRAICTYTDELSISIADLMEAVGADKTTSGFYVQAWGGQGGAGGADEGRGGSGAGGGYAQIYYRNLSSYEAAFGAPGELDFYYGGNGVASDRTQVNGGGGGASTLVASTDVTSGSGLGIPCIVGDENAVDQDGNRITVPNASGDGNPCAHQTVVALAAGGGGGGGTCQPASHQGESDCGPGQAGGAGGVAVGGTSTVVGRGTAGDSRYPNRAGAGGFNGVGATNHRFPSGDAGGGIGGLGGPYGPSDVANETRGGYDTSPNSNPFVGFDSNGLGGRGYYFQNGATTGGGGGGGFGGGGGGGGESNSGPGGSGGGGGGSYAYKGDAPSGEPPRGAPTADQGAVRVLIDGLPAPPAKTPPCVIGFHGTSGGETLTGTPGGDAMYGHGSADSIVAGPGDDCAFGGAKGDSISGGSGSDVLFDLYGNGGAGGDGGAGGLARPAGQARGTRDSGHDTLRGGRGADRLIAEGGRDTLTGGRGADTIKVNGGRHLLRGGRGNDRFRARDGKRDTVRCGPGDDVVWADRRDQVGRRCEKVRYS